METKRDTTEEKILEAAKTVFLNKGMDGARMQEIADEAGINKALLHYYFRSKERLFEAIFGEIVKFAFPKISGIIASDETVVTKIEQIIEAYIALLRKHPFIPVFVLKEINRDPSGLFKLIAKYGFKPEFVWEKLTEAMDEGEIVRTDPRHLVVNMISLCIFPFAARPILNYVIFKEDKDALEAFYAERAEVVKKFVVDAIVIKK